MCIILSAYTCIFNFYCDVKTHTYKTIDPVYKNIKVDDIYLFSWDNLITQPFMWGLGKMNIKENGLENGIIWSVLVYILIQFSLRIVYYLHGSNDSVAVRLLGVGEPCSLAKILWKRAQNSECAWISWYNFVLKMFISCINFMILQASAC